MIAKFRSNLNPIISTHVIDGSATNMDVSPQIEIQDNTFTLFSTPTTTVIIVNPIQIVGLIILLLVMLGILILTLNLRSNPRKNVISKLRAKKNKNIG